MKLQELIELYLHSEAFMLEIRTDHTRHRYKKALEILEKKFGAYTFKKLQSDMFFYEFETLIRKMQIYPAKTKYFLAVAKTLFNWGVTKRIIKSNPIQYAKQKRYRKPILTPWCNDLLAYAEQNFPLALKKYMIFATETGLRRCDLIRLRKSQHLINLNGQFFIHIEQSKTKKPVTIALSDVLLKEIKEIPHNQDYFIVSATGAPWTNEGFKSAWARDRAKAKKRNIILPRPHNFRKVTVRYLMEAGSSIEQAADMLGINVSTLQENYFERGSVSHIAVQKLNNYRRNHKALKGPENTALII